MKGPQVMMEYHNRPDATAKTIDGEEWLHTGTFYVKHNRQVDKTKRGTYRQFLLISKNRISCCVIKQNNSIPRIIFLHNDRNCLYAKYLTFNIQQLSDMLKFSYVVMHK